MELTVYTLHQLWVIFQNKIFTYHEGTKNFFTRVLSPFCGGDVEGVLYRMKTSDLPSPKKGTYQRARNLRNKMTKAEWKLWGNIRNKQLGVRFRRQHPIGNFIVDFIALKIGLVIEIDGAQHLESKMEAKDKIRTEYLKQQGLRVIRFNNHEVLTNIDGVIAEIITIIKEMDKK